MALRVTSMFSDDYDTIKQVRASRTDTWRKVLGRIMNPDPPPTPHVCRVYVVSRAALVEVPSHTWGNVAAGGDDGDALLLVLHYPKYAHMLNDVVPQYADLQCAARARCRRIAVLLMGIHKLRRSALLNISNRDVIGVLARAVWHTRHDLACMQVQGLPKKRKNKGKIRLN